MPTTHVIDVRGPVHYADHGGSGRPMVMVHGLGGSHLNWISVGNRFAERYRVVAPDLAGFGLTPPAGRSSTVRANRDLLDRFIVKMFGDEPVVLVGNSMGGLISMIEAADHHDRVAALVLVNPALPIVGPGAINSGTLRRIVFPIVPGIGPAYLKRYYGGITPEQQMDETFDMVCADSTRVSHAHRQVALEMVKMRRDMEWTASSFSEASRSIAGVLARPRSFTKMIHRIAAPTLLLHGDRDRVVDPASARWAANQRPDWTFVMLDDNGHVPQIETPELFFEVVETWLGHAVAG